MPWYGIPNLNDVNKSQLQSYTKLSPRSKIHEMQQHLILRTWTQSSTGLQIPPIVEKGIVDDASSQGGSEDEAPLHGEKGDN